MATGKAQGNKAQAQAQVIKCNVCGKVLKRNASIKAQAGHKCQQLQAKYTPAQLQAHYAGLTGNVPKGYITVASLHKTIVANKHKPIFAGLTVSKMVKAIGGDRALNAPAHPICKPVYNGRCRWVNGWLATQAGLQALATGNFNKAPKV